MSKKLPAWIVLTVISLVAALALGATYNGTKDRIAAQEAEKAVAVRQELLPAAADFEQIAAEGETEVFKGIDADGNAVGYVSVGTVTGFGGPVEVTVGMDGEGTLSGVRVGGSNFSETAGLGAKSKEPAFYEQFAGKAYPVDLSKNGGEIDAITAATITSSAVIRGVNETAKYIADVADIKLKEPVVAIEELGDNRYGTTAQGVSGPFPVVVTLDANGAVTAVEVQNTEAANDISYLSKVQGSADYLNQFVGKTAVTAAELDTVAGATVSSSSVNGAVSKVLLFVNDPAAYAAEAAAEADVPEVGIPEGAETFTEQGKGLTGTFDVTISVDENAAITGIAVGDASTPDDVPFLGQVKDNAKFLAQFIGRNNLVAEGDIETVTGATISSKGVIAAVNRAWSASQGQTEEPVAEPAAAPAADGNTVKAEGLTGKFDVTVELNEDGTVKAVTLGATDSDMDKDFLAKLDDAFLAQFAGKALPVSVDAVAGATVSSKAVIAAVNSFAPAAPAAPAAEAAGNTVKAEGLTGKFDVNVELNEDGTVKAVTLGATDSDMDKDFLAKLDDAFLAQFADKALPVSVDAVAGATVSSNAVIAAVNSFASATKAEAPAADDGFSAGGIAYVNGLTGTFPVVVALNADGTVKSVSLEKSDSDMDQPYLDKVTDEYLAQFVGKALPLEGIDTVAGATVSSKAIIEAVSGFAGQVGEQPAEEAAEAPAAAVAAGDYTLSARSFTDDLTVTVTVDENAAVSAVAVQDAADPMNAPYVQKVQNPAFLNQFVGLTGPVEAGDVQTVSGATFSSNAVIKAVGDVFTQPVAPDAAAPAEAPAEISAAGDHTVTARSFTDDLTVTVTLDDSAAVTAVAVQDAADPVNAPYVQKAQDEAFLSQFVGLTAPVAADDVQTVSGATFSSNAVISAVNDVFAQLGIEAPAAEAPAPAPAPEAHSYKDGAYEITEDGMNSALTLTVTIKDGAVETVTVADSDNADDAPYVAMVQNEAFLAQFEGAAAPVEDIDVVTGATFSAQAVLRGVNSALEAAE